MRMSWMTSMGLLFLIGTIISVTIQGQYVGADTTNVFNLALDVSFLQYTNPVEAVAGFFVDIGEFLRALWAMFVWEYSFFTGSFAIFRVAGIAVSLAFMVTLVLAIRGVGSH